MPACLVSASLDSLSQLLSMAPFFCALRRKTLPACLPACLPCHASCISIIESSLALIVTCAHRAAALKIQARVRGNAARKQAQPEPEPEADNDE